MDDRSEKNEDGAKPGNGDISSLRCSGVTFVYACRMVVVLFKTIF